MWVRRPNGQPSPYRGSFCPVTSKFSIFFCVSLLEYTSSLYLRICVGVAGTLDLLCGGHTEIKHVCRCEAPQGGGRRRHESPDDRSHRPAGSAGGPVREDVARATECIARGAVDPTQISAFLVLLAPRVRPATRWLRLSVSCART